MVLDVLTSVLLTVEEVHRLGYSINDLKNDNTKILVDATGGHSPARLRRRSYSIGP
jgi:hypothetical protein